MHDVIVEIKDGKLINRAAVNRFYSEHKDGKYEWVSKRTSKRSNQQNRYYWKCVVGAIKDKLIEFGNENIDSLLVHEMLKNKFNRQEIFNADGTVIDSIGASTAELPTMGFESYLEDIKRYAAIELDLYIADPNTQSVLWATHDHDLQATIIEPA